MRVYIYVCLYTRSHTHHTHTIHTQCKEVSCTRPGCVPLEVIITLIFDSSPQSSPQSSLQSSSSSSPQPSASSTSNNFKPSLSDLIKSGNYKAHIYKSAQSVTESDVKHVIPKCLGGAWDAKVEVQSLRLNLLNRIEGLEYNR